MGAEQAYINLLNEIGASGEGLTPSPNLKSATVRLLKAVLRLKRTDAAMFLIRAGTDWVPDALKNNLGEQGYSFNMLTDSKA